MFHQRPRHMKNCIYCGLLFFTDNVDAMLCPKCVDESGPEYREKGTIFGMHLTLSNSIGQLLKLHAVTNKNGADATVHVARERNVVRAPRTPIKALCGNDLKHVSGVQPLARRGSPPFFETHKEGENKWCPMCLRRLRKVLGGVRLHSFGTILADGYPMLVGYEPPMGQNDATQ